MYSLETPSVSAKAYPGVNVISWKPVTGAKSYKVTVYEEGAYKGSLSNISDNSCWDTDLKNGKNYTYYVEAVSSTNPGTADREAYAMNSRGEASVKAIVPPANTKSLELPAYEGGYDGKNVKTVSENDEWVVKPANIKAEVLNDKVYVSFPMKAYLNYNVKYYDNDLLPHDKNVNNGTTLLISYGNVQVISDKNANNVVGKTSFTITSAGKYQIAVVAKACGDYADSDEVVREELVTIEKLNLSEQTGNVTAKYLADGKTAQVSFEPAKKDEVYVPASWYKVYRRAKGEYETTEVTTGIKETLSVKEVEKADGSKTTINDAKYYYVEDTIADNKQVYEYIVVVENDGKYGNSKTATLNIETNLSVVEPTGNDAKVTAEYLYNVNHFATGADNTVRILFKPAQKDGNPVPTSWYKVYRAEILKEAVEDDNGKVETPEEVSLVQIEVTSATNKILLDDKDPGTYVVYDKITDPAKAYKYTVVVENDGNFKVRTGTLGKETKPKFNITVEDGKKVDGVYNDIEWTFTVGATDFDVKDITVYLLMTSDKQQAPEKNEVIAKGEKLSNFAKVKASDDYVVSKKNVSVGKAYVVVTAACDGYENAISNVSKTEIKKD